MILVIGRPTQAGVRDWRAPATVAAVKLHTHGYGLSLLVGTTAAIVAWTAGSVSKETANIVVTVLVTAAVTRAVDVYQDKRSARAAEVEHGHKERLQILEDRRAGLDEARRLLYIIRWSMGAPSPDLAATATNALIHHHDFDLPADELMLKLVSAGRTAGDENKQWLDALIVDVTRKRDSIMVPGDTLGL